MLIAAMLLLLIATLSPLIDAHASSRFDAAFSSDALLPLSLMLFFAIFLAFIFFFLRWRWRADAALPIADAVSSP